MMIQSVAINMIQSGELINASTLKGEFGVKYFEYPFIIYQDVLFKIPGD